MASSGKHSSSSSRVVLKEKSEKRARDGDEESERSEKKTRREEKPEKKRRDDDDNGRKRRDESASESESEGESVGEPDGVATVTMTVLDALVDLVEQQRGDACEESYAEVCEAALNIADSERKAGGRGLADFRKRVVHVVLLPPDSDDGAQKPSTALVGCSSDAEQAEQIAYLLGCGASAPKVRECRARRDDGVEVWAWRRADDDRPNAAGARLGLKHAATGQIVLAAVRKEEPHPYDAAAFESDFAAKPKVERKPKREREAEAERPAPKRHDSDGEESREKEGERKHAKPEPKRREDPESDEESERKHAKPAPKRREDSESDEETGKREAKEARPDKQPEAKDKDRPAERPKAASKQDFVERMKMPVVAATAARPAPSIPEP
jgi:hypothetical protein